MLQKESLDKKVLDLIWKTIKSLLDELRIPELVL
jgi:hypothetical protein